MHTLLEALTRQFVVIFPTLPPFPLRASAFASLLIFCLFGSLSARRPGRSPVWSATRRRASRSSAPTSWSSDDAGSVDAS